MKRVYLLFFLLFLSAKSLVCADYPASRVAYAEVYKALMDECEKDMDLKKMVSDLLNVFRREGGAGQTTEIAKKLVTILKGREKINTIHLSFLEKYVESAYERADEELQRKDVGACASNMMLACIVRCIRKNKNIQPEGAENSRVRVIASPPASSPALLPVKTYFRPSSEALAERWKKSEIFRSVFLGHEDFNSAFELVLGPLLFVGAVSPSQKSELKSLTGLQAFLEKAFIRLPFDQRCQQHLLESDVLAGMLCSPYLSVWITAKAKSIQELFRSYQLLARKQAIALLTLKTLATRPSVFYSKTGMNTYYSTHFKALFDISSSSEWQAQSRKRSREEVEE